MNQIRFVFCRPARFAALIVIILFGGLHPSHGETVFRGAIGPAADQATSFGNAISLDGGIALIGAWDANDFGEWSGAAYLLDADPESPSFGQQLKKLVDPLGASRDMLGHSVDLANGVAIVGVRSDDDAGVNVGSAIVFDADPNSATFGDPLAKLLPTQPDGLEYGYAVATNGTIALVASRSEDRNGNCFSCGGVRLFDVDRTNATFGQQVRGITASNAHQGNTFGAAVDANERFGLVTAAGGPPTDYLGSAYLIDIDPTSATFGKEVRRWPSSLGVAEGYFGYDAAIDEHIAIVTDHGSETAGAHIYDVDPASETFGNELLRIAAPNDSNQKGFGRSVAIDNGIAVIGVSQTGGGGFAYVYDVNPASAAFGELLGKLTVENVNGSSTLGEDVAIEDGRILVGGFTSLDDGGRNGAALVFETFNVPEPSTLILAASIVMICLPIRTRCKIIDPS